MVRHVVPAAAHGTDHAAGAAHWTAIYTLAGRSAFALRGTTLDLDAGSLVVFRREKRERATRDASRWESFIACFAPPVGWSPAEPFGRVGDGIYRARVGQAATRQRIREAFGRMISDARARNARRVVGSLPRGGATRDLDGGARRELLGLALREIFLLARDDGEGIAGVDERVRDALERMARDLAAPQTLASLGRAAGASPSRFGHLFRSELGISPIRALRLMRLEEAALQLRHTRDPVERIAEAAGFTSISHLSREFRRHFGVSPRAYRSSA